MFLCATSAHYVRHVSLVCGTSVACLHVCTFCVPWLHMCLCAILLMLAWIMLVWCMVIVSARLLRHVFTGMSHSLYFIRGSVLGSKLRIMDIGQPFHVPVLNALSSCSFCTFHQLNCFSVHVITVLLSISSTELSFCPFHNCSSVHLRMVLSVS